VRRIDEMERNIEEGQSELKSLIRAKP
jgi:hypothetical protein